VDANIVMLCGTVSAEPVWGPTISQTEFRVSTVVEGETKLLPIPCVYDGKLEVLKGDRVLIYGYLRRRFYRSGAGARSLTEVIVQNVTVDGAE